MSLMTQFVRAPCVACDDTAACETADWARWAHWWQARRVQIHTQAGVVEAMPIRTEGGMMHAIDAERGYLIPLSQIVYIRTGRT